MTFLPNTPYDYNFPTVNDNFSAQNLKENAVRMTAGKALGGSSVLHHMIQVRGNRRDYQRWATAADDSSWDYDSLLPYFIKSEQVKSPEILNSETGSYHGTEGYVNMTKEPHKVNKDILDAFVEMGYEYLVDVNGNKSLGVAEPLFVIDDGVRQSMAECHLSAAKDRSNLFVYKGTTVTKILFDDDKNAIGVETLTKDNKTVTIKARKEIILAAGVIRTPQILMLSGIGPKTHLKEFNIDVISDLPVGETFQDHFGVVVAHKLNKSPILTSLSPSFPDFKQFPAPTTVGFKSLDPDATYPDFQTINLRMPHNSIGLPSLCSNVFKYKNSICNEMIRSNIGRDLLFSVFFIMQPYSRGKVELRNTDPMDYPSIYTGYFSNTTDLDNLGSYLLHFSAIANTTYFKSVDAELVDFNLEDCNDLDRDSYDYWRCYGLKMSSTIWHPASTCPMGPVLDSKLNVRGVKKLRVVDASGLPSVNSGQLMAAVMVFAEKAADLIKEDM